MSEIATLERPIDIDLVRRTVAKGATDDELMMYLHDCRRRAIHPLDRLLHFSVRKDKDGSRRYTPLVSIDLFRSRAGDTGEHAGTDDAVYVTEPETAYPQSATVTVYRLKGGIRCPFTATARWFEYKPQEDFMWKKMPYTMLGKCAEALALRKAFPQELSGLYTTDEMEQAGPAESAPDPDLPPGKKLGIKGLSADDRARLEVIYDEWDSALAEIEQGGSLEDARALRPKYDELNNHADPVLRLAAPKVWQKIVRLYKAKGWAQSHHNGKSAEAAA